MHISENIIQEKVNYIEKLIEAMTELPERKKQLLSLVNMYTQHVLPFITLRLDKFHDQKHIVLPACGEYIGAVDALACSFVFSPVYIRAFDKYIDMHTKDLYKSMLGKINAYTNTYVEFDEGDIYYQEDLIIATKTKKKNDLVIIRNISPELNYSQVLQNTLDSLEENGLLVITTLSLKEAYAVRKTLDKEIQLNLLHHNPISVEGFIMNDEYIFVCRKI